MFCDGLSPLTTIGKKPMQESRFHITAFSTLMVWMFVLLSAANPRVAAAQTCGPQWLPGDGVLGTNGQIYAIAPRDPDGLGGQPSRILVAGSFSIAGNTFASNIAELDPASGQWTPFGSGLQGAIFAVASSADGHVFAAGDAGTGGVVAYFVAHWDGSSWAFLAQSMTERVHALAVTPDGHLIAGGDFTTIGGVNASKIARWTGSAWSPIGTGIGGSVRCIAVSPDGHLIAGGGFSNAGGAPASRIALWNGSTWSPMGSGVNGLVYAVATLPNGDVVAGGGFTTAGGVSANRIARWNGENWSPLGNGLDNVVTSLAVTPDGHVLVGGSFQTAGTVDARYIAEWSGVSWSSLGSDYISRPEALAVLPSGDRFACFGLLLLRWDGLAWSAPSGIGGGSPLIASSNGDVLAAFGTWFGGPSTWGVGRWDGSGWESFAPGMGVSALCELSNGDLLAGGRLTLSETVAANGIASWSGSSWSPIGGSLDYGSLSGFGGSVNAVLELAPGQFVAGGQFRFAGGTVANGVALWDGATWQALGDGVDGIVYALAPSPLGGVFVGGYFTNVGDLPANHIARWSGSSWSYLRSGVSESQGGSKVLCLLSLPNGDLIVAGRFSHADGVLANNIARWDGSRWSSLGTGVSDAVNSGPLETEIRSLALLQNGDIVAGGDFGGAGGVEAHNIARWDGQAWWPLGLGTDGPVYSLASLSNGEVAAGGSFAVAGGQVTGGFARFSFTGVPTVSQSPTPQNVSEGDTLLLTATPSNGYSGVSVQWYRNGAPVANGAGGASLGGGTVTGASASLSSPTRNSAASLRIDGVQRSDRGQYLAVFTNNCGSVSTAAAIVSLGNSCPGDLNGDTFVDDVDFVAFADAYNILDCADSTMPSQCPADLTGDAFVDDADFVLFALAYDALLCS